MSYSIFVAGPDVWRPVVGYEGKYEVSAHGMVRSLDRVVSMKNGKSKRVQGMDMLSCPMSERFPYPSLSLGSDAGRKTHQVHSLVATAFLGPKPVDKNVVCHRNDVKTDNRVVNLYWGTYSDNMRDRFRNDPPPAVRQCPKGHLVKAREKCSICLAEAGRKRDRKYREEAANLGITVKEYKLTLRTEKRAAARSGH